MGKLTVFLSWSGPLSQQVASKFEARLLSVLGNRVSVFFSDHMGRGKRPIVEIEEQLRQSNHAILFLTRATANEPWILLEAGAVGKNPTASKVCPILLDFPAAELPPPLRLLRQAVSITDKTGILSVFSDICTDAGGSGADVKRVLTGFDSWFQALNDEIIKHRALTLEGGNGWRNVTLARVAERTDDSPFQASDALRVAQRRLVFVGQNLFHLIRWSSDGRPEGYWEEILSFLQGTRKMDQHSAVPPKLRLVDILVLDPNEPGLVEAWGRTVRDERFAIHLEQCIATLRKWRQLSNQLGIGKQLNIKLARFIPISATFIDPDDADAKLLLRPANRRTSTFEQPVFLLTKRDHPGAFGFYWATLKDAWNGGLDVRNMPCG